MADIRAFIAITPDPAIIARVMALQQELRRAEADVSWVRLEGMHITLKFLGNVAEELVPTLGAALTELAQRTVSFNLSVAGCGVFPNLRSPRVFWAGIGLDVDALHVLAGAVDRTVATLGFPLEERPFRPHITLGRVKSPRGLESLLPLVAAHRDDTFGVMQVTAIHLIRSELSPQGARYTTLRCAPLAGA